MPRSTLFRLPILRSPFSITASRGSIDPFPDLPVAAAEEVAPLGARGAAEVETSLSPAKNLMYSVCSLAPSNQVIRSNRSTKRRLRTWPLSPSSSLSCATDALYSGIAFSRFSQAKKMLRRLTKVSCDKNRVWASRGTATRSGSRKVRWVASDKGTSSVESSDAVGKIVFFWVIAWRSRRRGLLSTAAIVTDDQLKMLLPLAAEIGC